MTINENTYELTTFHYDYGVPIIFEAGTEQGFSIGDKIIFVFDNQYINDKIFEVNNDNYTFELALEKEEADNLYMNKLTSSTIIKYSAKRYRENQFLETLVNSTLKIEGTVRWEGDDNGKINSEEPSEG